MSITVYECSARVISGGKFIAETIEKARTYYNTLVDARNSRMLAFREIRSQVLGAVDLELHISVLEDAVSKGDKTHLPELKALRKQHAANCRSFAQKVDEISESAGIPKYSPGEHKSSFSKRREAAIQQAVKDGVVPAWWARIKALHTEKLAVSKNAKVPLGLTGAGAWGTYSVAQRAFDTGDVKSAGRLMRRRRFDGTGIVGTSMVPVKTTWGSLLLCGTKTLKFEPTDDLSRLSARAVKRGIRHYKVTMQTPFGDVVLSVKLTRPIPQDAKLTADGVKLVVRRTGYTYRHYLLLTVDTPRPEEQLYLHGTAAINFGWRSSDGELLAATMCDSDGNVERVFVGAVRDKLKHAAAIQSAAAGVFAEARHVVAARVDVPPKYGAALSNLAQHKSPNRLLWVALDWALATFGGSTLKGFWQGWVKQRKEHGKDLFCDLSELERDLLGILPEHRFIFWLYIWRRKYMHLVEYGAHVRKNALLSRREIYRTFAAKLFKRYEYVVVDDASYAALAATKGDIVGQAANSNRFVVSPGEFREIVKNKLGDRLIKKSAINVSSTHHSCGGELTLVDRRRAAVVECQKCRADVDVDINACMNLLTE